MALPAPEAEPSASHPEVSSAVFALRQKFRDFAITTRPDPTLKRDLKAGFLLPYLLDFDALTYGRWAYWFEAMETEALPDRPIPQVDFLSSADPRTRKMLETTLNAIPACGIGWQSMGAWDFFRYFLQWILWGFGHPGYEEPIEPFGCEGASMRLYQITNLCAWMLWPHDYLGELLAENAYGQKQGFFPTPMSLCLMMTQMLMECGEDMRLKTVCDPAVGRGRFLLTASNYSLRLYGQDIDQMMCMATLVNGYLYSPWLVKPLPFLDRDNLDPSKSEQISESITAQAPPHFAEDLAETEFDEALAPNVAPIKKRCRRGEPDSGQGTLF